MRHTQRAGDDHELLHAAFQQNNAAEGKKILHLLGSFPGMNVKKRFTIHLQKISIALIGRNGKVALVVPIAQACISIDIQKHQESLHRVVADNKRALWDFIGIPAHPII